MCAINHLDANKNSACLPWICQWRLHFSSVRLFGAANQAGISSGPRFGADEAPSPPECVPPSSCHRAWGLETRRHQAPSEEMGRAGQSLLALLLRGLLGTRPGLCPSRAARPSAPQWQRKQRPGAILGRGMDPKRSGDSGHNSLEKPRYHGGLLGSPSPPSGSGRTRSVPWPAALNREKGAARGVRSGWPPHTASRHLPRPTP